VINASLPGDETGRKADDMNAYRTFGLLLSSLLLAACGTSVIGGGGGAGTGNDGTGAGETGTGTGGSCTPSTGDHNISTSGISLACTQDSDCTVVFTGDACQYPCSCPSGAIASSAMAEYDQKLSAAQEGCCPVKACALPCPDILVSCQQGVCTLGAPTDVCNGVPSPASCTATSCPSGFSCVPDPDPTTCHPTDCSCVGNGWACDDLCMMNGSSCVKGA
jgi:hypothetical protein